VCSRNNIACVPDVGTLGDGTLGDEERPQSTWFCSQFVILQRRSGDLMRPRERSAGGGRGDLMQYRRQGRALPVRWMRAMYR